MDILDMLGESTHCPFCGRRVKILDDKISNHEDGIYRPGAMGKLYCKGSGQSAGIGML